MSSPDDLTPADLVAEQLAALTQAMLVDDNPDLRDRWLRCRADALTLALIAASEPR
jgi:hypothetical protein